MAKVKVDPDVQKLIDEYNSAYNILCRSGEFLYGARLSAAKTIANVEDLVNSIANHPKTFDTNIEAIKFNKEKFAGAQEFAKQEYENAKKGAVGAAAGVGAGGAIAAMGPTAAMWVATTFGTASTGNSYFGFVRSCRNKCGTCLVGRWSSRRWYGCRKCSPCSRRAYRMGHCRGITCRDILHHP